MAATAHARDGRIDALKGFAIVCVVAYHAAGQYFSYSPATGVVYYPWAVELRALLFSFMLPLFTFMSGYVLGRTGGFRPRDYFKKRTLGLLVPYVAWETIYGPGRDKHPEMLASVSNFLGYYVHIFIDPRWEGRMWYLYALWIVLMFLGVSRLLGDRTWVLLLSAGFERIPLSQDTQRRFFEASSTGSAGCTSTLSPACSGVVMSRRSDRT